MKANELRIGNLVYDSNDLHILKIEGIDSNKEGFNGYFIRSNNGSQISSLEDFEENEDDKFIQPIPLTEEWLVKFGCSKIGINYQFKNIAIWYSSYDKCYKIRYFLVGSNVEKHINLKYVHTFQNVINTLTGEEITIKN